jgi:hypothetical protein
MPDVVTGLTDAWEAFAVPLRMRDGFDEAAFTALVSSLSACAREWDGADALPRRGVNVLVDILPTLEALIESYEPAVSARIREASFELQESIWECVAVDAG